MGIQRRPQYRIGQGDNGGNQNSQRVESGRLAEIKAEVMALGYQDPAPGRRERTYASENFIAWAAWHGIEAIGFLELYVRPFANGCDSRPVPFLEGIWVDSSWRSKGIGRQLLHAAVNWARSEGFTEMGSDADLDNTVSHQAHSAWGFVETERVIYFRKKL